MLRTRVLVRLRQIPYGYVEAGIFIVGCIATGAVLGVVGVLVQMEGERRGQ